MRPTYREIEGDLIEYTMLGMFDMIAHGCNCFCTMGAGLAPQMAKAFGCDRFPMEHPSRRGDKNKLGKIDDSFNPVYNVWVINAYTQYNYGRNHEDGDQAPLNYDALRSCMREINYHPAMKANTKVGLPMIGAGLAGGDWNKIKQIIQEELTNPLTITIVKFNKQ